MTRSTYGCPVELTLAVLGGKWKTVLLAHLKGGPQRYRDLRERVPGLSDKMLTQRLRELEEAGLVERGSSTEAAAYALSGRGRSLGPVLQALYDWGVQAEQEANGPVTHQVVR